MTPLDNLEAQIRGLEEVGVLKIKTMSHTVIDNMWLFELDVVLYDTRKGVRDRLVQWQGVISQPGKYQQSVKEGILFKIRQCYGDPHTI